MIDFDRRRGLTILRTRSSFSVKLGKLSAVAVAAASVFVGEARGVMLLFFLPSPAAVASSEDMSVAIA